MLNLNWIKYDNGNWFSLLDLDLTHSHFQNMEGVYVIAHGGPNPRSVRVGQGIIKDRLAEHRENSEILQYRNLGLYVSWAPVIVNLRDGVERFLGNQTAPLVGSRFPEVPPIQVNLP